MALTAKQARLEYFIPADFYDEAARQEWKDGFNAGWGNKAPMVTNCSNIFAAGYSAGHLAELEYNRNRDPLRAKSPIELTADRKSTHGDWHRQSELAHELHERMRSSPNWGSLKPYQLEALDMIQTKVSRILCGNPAEPDHWDDIGGYALLGKGGHK